MVLTGAGVSAESGVPTFRGAGGFWREYAAQDLATPYAFRRDPSLVWEFYHYRREVMREKYPNPAHIAIAEAEKRQIYTSQVLETLKVILHNFCFCSDWNVQSKKFVTPMLICS